MRYAKVALFAAVVVLVTVLFAPSAQAGVSFSFFYSNLSPHGSWQVSAEYGRVWQPYVYNAGWNPYYDGHWAYSDLGWAWVSDYEWGSIPYHYGTWVLDPYYGWVWVPGYTWAPSWVVFRTGPDYIGWAPVSPGFSVGVSFGSYAPAPSSFVFVSAHNFLAPRIRSCYVPRSRTTVIINNTRIVNNLVVENNVVVNRGPDRRFVERASGRSVREVPIERVSRAMPGSRLSRSELRVDPQRARRGLRAAEPVSANRPLPDTRQRDSASVEAPRTSRLSGDIDRQRGMPATRGNASADAPRTSRRESASMDAPRTNRRLTSDTEKQRRMPATRESGTMDSPRTSRRQTGDIERQRSVDARSNSRRVPSENRMRRQESPQRVYREQPGVQNRAQRPTAPDINRPGRVSPRDAGANRQSVRPESQGRRPDAGNQGADRKEEPSRGKSSGKTQERKSHGSGKK